MFAFTQLNEVGLRTILPTPANDAQRSSRAGLTSRTGGLDWVDL